MGEIGGCHFPFSLFIFDIFFLFIFNGLVRSKKGKFGQKLKELTVVQVD